MAWSLGNYWASFGEDNEFQVYIGPQAQDVLTVNVPAPAAPIGQGYELVYDVLKTGDSEPSSFFLDFEATDAATICIGLPDENILQRAVLYQADFAGKTPLLTDGPLRLFGFPDGWNGWRGAKPPSRVAPLRLSSDPIPLYANASPFAPLMRDNPCKGVPPSGPGTLTPPSSPTPGTPTPAPTAPTPAPGNAAPVASNVTVTGTFEVCQTLTGHYNYTDADSDLEGTSLYQWYRAANNSGASAAPIAGATADAYTPLIDVDEGKFLRFEVMPVAASGASPSSPAFSAWTGPVALRPFLDVEVTSASADGASDIFEFYVQEPGGPARA